MTKPETPISAGIRYIDPEIDRLLYVGRIIGNLVNRAHTLLEPHEFPKSLAVIAALSETFNRELEASLLQTYDGTTEQTLS
jgi:hypothetical protein